MRIAGFANFTRVLCLTENHMFKGDETFMLLWQSLLLGLVQGLTEFLPVSSSGHLVLFQSWFGFDESNVFFDVCLHCGTVLAVLAVYWRDILDIFRHFFSRETLYYVIAAIPVALAGFLLNDLITGLFNKPLFVCFALVLSGVWMFLADFMHGYKEQREMRWYDALVIGVFQGFAIVPGLSRSGSSIFGALLMGMERPAAARFSFILSVPVVLGAGFYELHGALKIMGATAFQWVYLPGILLAAVAGYLAIKFFVSLLNRGTTRYFAYYCWALAIVSLLIIIF